MGVFVDQPARVGSGNLTRLRSRPCSSSWRGTR
jgi:hypothetical protein